MPVHDAWDWPVLLYVTTVMFKRTEAQFWRMTPRKLNALNRAHIKLNPRGDESRSPGSEVNHGFIDDLF